MSRTIWVLGLALVGCGIAATGDGSDSNDAVIGATVGMGAPFDTPDPDAGTDPCVETDTCADAAPPDDAGTNLYPVGSHLLTRTYALLHKSASGGSDVFGNIAPKGGVPNDSFHLWGNPSGMIPPAQEVKLVSASKVSGFYQVEYDGTTGWVAASKIFLVDPKAAPLDFFLSLSATDRNAFFKRQTHRSEWNKDGPYQAETCAPTSLAMAARILGHEPQGLSIEQSIHRVRETYGDHSDVGATYLDQIYAGATSNTINLKAEKLWTPLSPADAMTRLDNQLKKGRLVQLAGLPGAVGAARSKYESAFDSAYAAAGMKGTVYGFDPDECHCDGHHSIVVTGRETNGRYIVGDPMSEIGFVALDAAAMKDFMVRWQYGGTGNAVWQ